MELLCPECLGTLESADGHEARCTVHGGTFEILFARSPIAAPPRNAATQSVRPGEGATCIRHPDLTATHACVDCGQPICPTCVFTEMDGSQVCPDCAQRRAVFGTPPVLARQIAQGGYCVQHPQVPATAQCQTCGGFMCDTCKFDLPGGLHVCPTCAANPRASLSPKKKKLLIGSYVTAIWCTFMMALLFGGAFQGMARDRQMVQALGLLLMVTLLAPSILGVALGVGAKHRRMPNSISVWVAIIWNGLFLGGFILMTMVGMLSK